MKKFMYILLIIIVMFINTGNCYAAAPKKDNEFAFTIDKFTKPTFDEIMQNYYNTTELSAISFWFLVGDSYMSISYSDFQVRSGNGAEITKIIFGNGESAEEVYSSIKSHSAWEDIKKSYCTNAKGKDKELCDKLQKQVDNSSTNSRDEGKNCDYNFKNLGSKKDLSMSFVFNITEKGVSVYSTDSRVITQDSDFIRFSYNDSTIPLYLHEKGQEYDEFKEAYLKAYKNKNKTNINSSGCPILYLLEDKKKEWYTTLNEELCKKPPIEIYTSGTCQTTSGGETQSITYFEAPDLPDLITGDMTSITCNDIIKKNGDLQKILKSIVNIVKILVPIALLVLGTLDIAQAIFAGDESKMKKSQSKFMKRLLIALVIFLIPSVLKVILTIANGIWPIISSDLCGIL